MLENVHNMRDEIVEITQGLIRIPSFTGQEKEIAHVIQKKYCEYGLDDCFIDEIGNVVGILYGNKLGPTILLNGHLDVVPVGNRAQWNGYDPFGAEIDDMGNIHGRGASDLKGGLSVQIASMKLMKSIRDSGRPIAGNIIGSGVVHEESATMFGMDYLCTNTLPQKNMNCDVVFICEPTGLDVVLGQRGKVELVIKTFGKTAHSSVPEAGINALEKMNHILSYIFQQMPKDMNGHPLLGKESITVTNLTCSPGALSIIPDECEISIDRRFLPGEDIDALCDEFNQLFRKLKETVPDLQAQIIPRALTETSYTGYQKEVKKYHPPWITEEGNTYVQSTLKALSNIGQAPNIRYWKFGTDGSMTSAILGIPTIGYSGTEECYAHTPFEIVNIDMMMKSLEGYYAILCGLMGVDFF